MKTMLLAIDVGNSAVKGGLFEGDQLVSSFRVPHAPGSEEGVVDRLLPQMSSAPVHRAAMASVVPRIAEAVKSGLSSRRVALTHVSHDCRLPIRLRYDDPAQLGADRIAAAAAAYVFAPTRGVADRPLVVIDAGTAVTFNVVDSKGEFLGGVIWAGPDLVLQALHGGTANLPLAMQSGPPQPIATETEQALHAGAMLGFVEGARGVVRRIADALGSMPAVFVTGGRGEALLETLVNPIWEPHLVLHGVRIVADLNDR